MSALRSQITVSESIEIIGGAAITDPCYADESNGAGNPDATWRRGGAFLPDATGNWTLNASIGDDPGWGRRVFEFRGTNSASYGFRGETRTETFDGDVDAGLMGLVPVTAMGFDWDEFCEELFQQPGFRRSSPDADQQLAAVKGQVCCSSGMGDGTYPIKVTFCKETNLALSFEVDFYGDEEEDTYYDEGEDED